MDPVEQVERFRAQLAAEGSAERAAQTRAYLKSGDRFYGVPVPAVRAMARAFKQENPRLGRSAVVALVETLFCTDEHELRLLAIALLESYRRVLEPDDMDRVESLLRQCQTWDLVDWLATAVSAWLVERYPALQERLARWAQDPSFWLRRAALLSLLEPLRKGRGDFALFAQLAVPMLGEKEFFIRKAIGWVLRDVSRKRPELTHAFLLEHIRAVSPLTLREGARQLPESLREELLRARG